MPKGSSKTTSTANSLNDWFTFFTNGLLDRKIQFTNLVTNWNKIANKPSTFPVDGTANAAISGKWTFVQAIEKTVDEKISPGANVIIEMDKGNLLYIEPDTNFTLETVGVFEGDCVVIIKQPAAGGPYTMTLEPGRFAFAAVPTLSVAANAIDVLVLRHNVNIGRTIVIDFLQGLTLN